MGGNEEFDASGDGRLTPDETEALEGKDHLVDRGWAEAEVALHVGLGRRVSADVRISVDEGQILALFFGEAFAHWGDEQRLIFDSSADSSGPPTRRPR